MNEDTLDNWLAEDIEVSKQRLFGRAQGTPEMVERWQAARMRECQIPAEFWDMQLDDHWLVRQDARGNDLTAQQGRKKEAAANFVRKYINVLPYLCRGKKLRLCTKDEEQSKYFQSLILVGPQESGKSFLAATIAKAAALLGEDVRWYDYCELVTLLKNRSFTSEQEQADTVADFKSLAMVFIDAVDADIDLEARGTLAMKTLARVRRGTGLPFVITCKHDVLLADDHPLGELLHAQYAHRLVLPATKV
ncbi:MAG: ATP-binding protein [Armatimonadetes bacterium]|nr:ATP-binding protein [Armatimonadota bacterium]